MVDGRINNNILVVFRLSIKTIVLLFCSFLAVNTVNGAVHDLTVTDVTTRSFSLVWVSDEPILDATVNIYCCANTSTDITSSFGISSISAESTNSHDLGIAKILITGLHAEQCVYVQTRTVGVNETVLEPAVPLLQVCTEKKTTKADITAAPILNDLIEHHIFWPQGTNPVAGSLLLIKIPSIQQYPLSVLVGAETDPKSAIVDLNNVFSSLLSSNANLDEGAIIELTEMKGLGCAEFSDHKLVRFRRVPAHSEVDILGQKLVEVETTESCFSADTVCNDSVDIIDVQYGLNILNATETQCKFNPDIDVVQDGTINVLDIQSILNFVGQTAPF